MKKLLIYGLLTGLFSPVFGACPASYSTGDGSTGNPCQVSTATQLQDIKDNLDQEYVLINDIDLTGATWTSISSFQGILDGANYTVRNLTASGGLFTSLGVNGDTNTTIKNLTLANFDLNSATNVGCLSNSNTNYTVAINNITVKDSNVTSTASGNVGVGGLIGYVNAGSSSSITTTISDINVTDVNITGVDRVGGIVGNLRQHASITNAKSSGTVTASSSKVGGIVGFANYGTIHSSSSSADVVIDHATNGTAGGIAGSADMFPTYSVQIENCYFTGTVTTTGNNSAAAPNYGLGGIVGYIWKTQVKNSYVTGSVENQGTVGGIGAHATTASTITKSYYINTITSNSTTDGLSRSDAQLKTLTTFSTWDITGADGYYPTLTKGGANIWIMSASDTTAPTVSSTTPANSATSVTIDSNMTVTFSEAMNAATITTSNVTLKDSINNPIAGAVTYSGTTATFKPDNNLSYSQEYNLTISSAVTDTIGNALVSAYSISFTTLGAATVDHNVTVGGVSTTATFDVNVTTIDNVGARESNVTMGTNNSDVNVTAYSDGKAFHLVKTASSPKITKANFDILGATSHINTTGDIETKISPIADLEVGCTLKAVITTYNNGESYSRFVRNCGSDEIKETSLAATPFELGNKIRVYETVGEMTIEVNATITREIKF